MRTKIKIAICDDEKIFLEIIIKKLELTLNQLNFQDYDILSFHNGLDLLKSKEQFHLILLDIEMPEADGLSLAKRINNSEVRPLIIFITSHKELMPWGFHVNAFRYLTKPFNDHDFNEAIDSALKKILLVETIIIDTVDYCILVDVRDIIYIESLGEGCCIYTNSSNYIRKETLKYWLNRLPKNTFVQTHRAFVVNLESVYKIETTHVHLKNGNDIPVSFRRRKILNDSLHDYIRRKSRR